MKLAVLSQVIRIDLTGIRTPDHDGIFREAEDITARLYALAVPEYRNALLKEDGVVKVDVVQQNVRMIRFQVSHLMFGMNIQEFD